MRFGRLLSSAGIGCCIAWVGILTASAQDRIGEPRGGPLSSMPVRNAPFTANVTTTVSEVEPVRARGLRESRATYYRDSFGRVRVDVYAGGTDARVVQQTFLDLNPDAKDFVYALDPLARVVRSVPHSIAAALFSGDSTFAEPLSFARFRVFFVDPPEGSATAGTLVEPLGTRTLAGEPVIGHRVSRSGAADTATGDRWESPRLKVVVASTLRDATLGTFEYSFTALTLEEPSGALFTIPPGYTTEPVAGNDSMWLELRGPSRR